MRMTEAVVTIKSKVEKILNKFPITRDSDKLLWLGYLVQYHNLKTALGEEGYKALKAVIMHEDTPTMESVRRVRQKLQEEGKYQGNKRKDRLEEADGMRELMSET